MTKKSLHAGLQWAALAVGLLLVAWGFHLRLQLAYHDDVWVDELHTAWCVTGPFAEVASRATSGNQSPLYFLASYPVFDLFGSSKMALRAPAVLCGLALLISIPAVTWLWTRSAPAALLTLVIAVVDDSFIFFSSEARPYAAVQFVGLWQFYYLVRCLDRTSFWHHIRLLVSSVLLFYLHYTSVLFLLAEACALSALLVFPAYRAPIARIFRTSLIVAALAIPGCLHIWALGSSSDQWRSIVSLADYADALLPVWLAAIIVPTAFLATVWLRSTRPLQDRRGQDEITLSWSMQLWMVLACSAIPVAIAAAATATGLAPLAMYRYTIASQVTVVLSAGLIVARVPGIPLQAACWLTALAAALGFSATALQAMRGQEMVHQRSEPWKQVVGDVNAASAADPVFVFPNLVEDERFAATPTAQLQSYYQFPVVSLYPIDKHGDRVIVGCPIPGWGGFTGEQLSAIDQSGAAWLIIRAAAPDAEFVCDQIAEQEGQRGGNVVFEVLATEPLYLIRVTWVAR